MTLSPAEQRVLGALIEKEITTPEYYPLSLNSLQAAANQRSSRDPVMTLGEDEVRSALDSLAQLGLVTATRDARTPKFEHRARTILQLRRDETAILCLLLLRGPQTPGELRSRADRLHPFEDLDAVVSTLDRLAARPTAADSSGSAPGPLTAILPRQPGARESRYAHLLGATPATQATSAPPSPPPQQAPDSPELADLRDRVLALEQRIEQLEQRLSSGSGGAAGA